MKPRQEKLLNWARRIAAGGILIALGVISVWGNHGGPIASCSDMVARVGQQAIVRSCHGIGLSDTFTVVGLLLAALLLLPDVPTIKIAGLLELRREIEAQGHRTEELLHNVNVMMRTNISITNVFTEADAEHLLSSDVDSRARRGGFVRRASQSSSEEGDDKGV